MEIELMADAKSPAVAYLFAAIARVHLLQGDTVVALGSARAARLVTAGETIPSLELGQALLCANRHQPAVKELNSVLDRDPEHVEALRIRGEIYADWGKSRQALDDLSRVDLAASPSARAARILAASSEAPVSWTEIAKLREKGRTHGLVLLCLARSLRRHEDRNLAANSPERLSRRRIPACRATIARRPKKSREGSNGDLCLIVALCLSRRRNSQRSY